MGSQFRRFSDWYYYYGVLPILAAAPRRLRRKLVPGVARYIQQNQELKREEVRKSLCLVSNDPNLESILTRNFQLKVLEDLEYFLYPSWNSRNICEQFEFTGLQYLKEAQVKGKGAILVTAHLGPFCSAVVAMGHRGFPLNYIAHNSPDDPRFSRAYRRYAKKKIAAMEAASGRPFKLFNLGEGTGETTPHVGLHTYSTLQKAEFVSMAIDIPPTLAQNSERVTFLGRSCNLADGFLKLAYLAECPVMPFFSFWNEQEWEKRQIIVAHPIPLQGSTRSDLQAIADTFSQVIESRPAQWFAWDSLSHFLAETPAP